MLAPDPRSIWLCRSLVAVALLSSVIERAFLLPELHSSAESKALLLVCAAASAMMVSKWSEWGSTSCAVAWTCLMRLGPGLSPLTEHYGDQLLRNILLALSLSGGSRGGGGGGGGGGGSCESLASPRDWGAVLVMAQALCLHLATGLWKHGDEWILCRKGNAIQRVLSLENFAQPWARRSLSALASPVVTSALAALSRAVVVAEVGLPLVYLTAAAATPAPMPTATVAATSSSSAAAAGEEESTIAKTARTRAKTTARVQHVCALLLLSLHAGLCICMRGLGIFPMVSAACVCSLLPPCAWGDAPSSPSPSPSPSASPSPSSRFVRGSLTGGAPRERGQAIEETEQSSPRKAIAFVLVLLSSTLALCLPLVELLEFVSLGPLPVVAHVIGSFPASVAVVVANDVAAAAGFGQEWAMFAPLPPGGDAWLEFSAISLDEPASAITGAMVRRREREMEGVSRETIAFFSKGLSHRESGRWVATAANVRAAVVDRFPPFSPPSLTNGTIAIGSARVDLRGALAALACAAARRRRGVTPKGIKGARVLEAVEVTPVYRPLVWVERASTFAEGPEERAAAVLMLCEPETT